MNAQETLIFLHIPKTAGTTVSVTLTKWFAPHELFHIRSGRHAGAPRFSSNFGPEQDFRALPHSERKRFRCILGHAKFGLHEAIPGPARYFTLLRNPLDRYVSQVAQYNRMAKRGELGRDARPVSLYEYRQVKPFQFTNPQTRWISGRAVGGSQRCQDSEVLELAKRNVTRWFPVIGVVEQIGQSLALLASICGGTLPVIKRENASPERPSISEFSLRQRREFDEHNLLDKELWRFANQRLQLQLSNLSCPRKRLLWQRAFEPFAKVASRFKAA